MKSIVFIILLSFSSCNPEKSKGKIEIFGLKEFYSENDVVRFQVHSNLEDTAYYYLGLESYIGDEWRPLILDISRPHSKVSKILSIATGEKREVNIQLNKIRTNLNGLKKFRFVISYGLSFNNIGYKLFSNPLEIRD